ncbi:MAG: glutamine synthetase III [Clostridia bacterium]
MARITESKRITDFFGSNVFNDEKMKQYLSTDAYLELKEVIDNHKTLNKELANIVAKAMQEWASDNGATHYTHWFQPLTGATAEKHDSFISIDKQGNTILEFTGKNLLKGETDASSFPSGGIRATFEARGYTMWDCSSPAFIKKGKDGAAILYIPTAFCSYNGEALDKKTPLLRSMDALDFQARRILTLLGKEVKRVVANVGGEQEYFLIDKNDYEKRMDLRFTGRTLFGAMAPKGQEKDNQYYASIKDRVSSFMADLNEELWRLGITAKTQHNEAAPSQHELAPIFCSANIATDQNQLIMETMKKVASNHNLACLLHEKPFEHISGSGKHNNWSLNTTEGDNLFKPKEDAYENLIFLTFFISVIAAVDEYSDLLRASASTASNEHRLGGHEAPPSIISMYVGKDMEEMLDNFANGKSINTIVKQYIKTGVNYLAEFKKDTSDRNRTSPFAFTGNKFEFRMVGSSATLSNPNTTINLIVAEELCKMSDELEKDENPKKVLPDILRRIYLEHKRIIFSGDNYSKDWQKEAKKRGLLIVDNCVDAYECLTAEKNVDVYVKHKVLTEKEIFSRKEIYLNNYNNLIKEEALTMINMVNKLIMPAIEKYAAQMAEQIAKLVAINPSYGGVIKQNLQEYEELEIKANAKLTNLKRATVSASKTADSKKQAILCRDHVNSAMEDLRAVIDNLEERTEKKLWPFPTYEDILFYE